MSGFSGRNTFANIKQLLEAAASDVGLNGNKLTNLATPVNDQDAATKAYVDSHSESGAASLSATDNVYYVSVGSKASDLNDGRSFGQPFATIAHALTVLGTGEGTIHLLAGMHYVPAGGISLGHRQALRGAGGTSTILYGGNVAPGGYLVAAKGSRCQISDLWITTVPAGGVGCLVSVGGPPVGSHTNQNTLISHVYVDTLGSGAIAFGIGSDTGYDVSETMLVNCSSAGNNVDSYHIVAGDGSFGNVLDFTVWGGSMAGHGYGIKINGAAGIIRGVSATSQKFADFYIRKVGLGHLSIDGGRSENAKQFIYSEVGPLAQTKIKVSNFSALGIMNTDGVGIDLLSAAGWEFDNVSIAGDTCPQYARILRQASDWDYAPTFSANRFASDHCYPFLSPYAHPGLRMSVRDTQFIADSNFQLYNRRKTEHWIRRKSIVSGGGITSRTAPSTAWTMNARLFDELEINLSGNAGTFTLEPGDAPGQTLRITWIQDAAGGWTYSWPAMCGFSGGTSPSNVLTARARQSCVFEWSGVYWAQTSSVVDSIPPTPIADPIDDTFTTGERYFLSSAPSVSGSRRWEIVPGGGAFGIQGGKCVTVCLGWMGDTDTTITSATTVGGFVSLYPQAAAGAVYDTGLETCTIVTTFVFNGNGAGVITQYADDQNLVTHDIDATRYLLNPYANGRSLGSFAYLQSLGTTLTAGRTYTLTVQITATGYVSTLVGATEGTITIGGFSSRTFTTNASEFALVKHNTRHGIISHDLGVSFSRFQAS